VGFIALAGVAAETGVVMIVYLDESWRHLKLAVARPALPQLYDAVMEGAVQRVRPKMMTVSAIIAGLLPIMWSHGTGADTMKRIAAPMVGGMVSSTVLTLLIIPAIYYLWRSREIAPVEPSPASRRRRLAAWSIAIVFAIAVFAWLRWAPARGGGGAAALNTPVLTQSAAGYEVRVLGADANLHARETPIRIEIRDAATGEPVEAEMVSLALRMDMPGMPMAADAVLQKTGEPGVWTGMVRPSMAGEWVAAVRIRGPRGEATTSATVNVRE
jgi:hypothetical protein